MMLPLTMSYPSCLSNSKVVFTHWVVSTNQLPLMSHLIYLLPVLKIVITCLSVYCTWVHLHRCSNWNSACDLWHHHDFIFHYWAYRQKSDTFQCVALLLWLPWKMAYCCSCTMLTGILQTAEWRCATCKDCAYLQPRFELPSLGSDENILMSKFSNVWYKI